MCAVCQQSLLRIAAAAAAAPKYSRTIRVLQVEHDNVDKQPLR